MHRSACSLLSGSRDHCAMSSRLPWEKFKRTRQRRATRIAKRRIAVARRSNGGHYLRVPHILSLQYECDMTIKSWLDAAVQDAERRGLAALKPLLETFARATSALRSADWNDDATGELEGVKDTDAR